MQKHFNNMPIIFNNKQTIGYNSVFKKNNTDRLIFQPAVNEAHKTSARWDT